MNENNQRPADAGLSNIVLMFGVIVWIISIAGFFVVYTLNRHMQLIIEREQRIEQQIHRNEQNNATAKRVICRFYKQWTDATHERIEGINEFCRLTEEGEKK